MGTLDRRRFLQTAAGVSASLMLRNYAFGAKKRSVLVFTKSSGFEHQVVKRVDGKPSILENAVTTIGNQHGFDVITTKDGSIFDSGEFRSHAAVLFFTTGDLTTVGTDKNPAMSPQGKQSLLDAVHGGMGFIGVHAAADTFHTPPDTPDNANRYIAHGEQSDPYIRMLGGEFITHGSTPRLQNASIIVDDPQFPGLERVSSPFTLNDEWYSLKDFRSDLHVILTLDTKGMAGEPYQRAPYPMTWARMEGTGRVFYTAIGDRPENWSNSVFLNLLAGGIRWSIGNARASLNQNLSQAAPGYAEIPPKPSPKH
jgi:uncharacterized protein